MPILSFDAAAVTNLILDARSATSFMPKWDGPITTPGFVLVVDQGIYLMSNAAAVPVAHDAEQLPAKPRAFAAGFNPDESDNWYEARNQYFRNFSGIYHLDMIDDIAAFLQQGDPTVRFSLKDHIVSLYDPVAANITVGEVYNAPSGLGGVFRVEVLEVDAVRALVQNKGNCEDFDDMAPYRVPCDYLRPIGQGRAA